MASRRKTSSRAGNLVEESFGRRRQLIEPTDQPQIVVVGWPRWPIDARAGDAQQAALLADRQIGMILLHDQLADLGVRPLDLRLAILCCGRPILEGSRRETVGCNKTA